MAETNSLLNCRTGLTVPGVRIPHFPQKKIENQFLNRGNRLFPRFFMSGIILFGFVKNRQRAMDRMKGGWWQENFEYRE